jgi:hypothetical protein
MRFGLSGAFGLEFRALERGFALHEPRGYKRAGICVRRLGT